MSYVYFKVVLNIPMKVSYFITVYSKPGQQGSLFRYNKSGNVRINVTMRCVHENIVAEEKQ